MQLMSLLGSGRGIVNKLARSTGIFLVEQKLLVYVHIAIATIFDFMTKEDWGW